MAFRRQLQCFVTLFYLLLSLFSGTIQDTILDYRLPMAFTLLLSLFRISVLSSGYIERNTIVHCFQSFILMVQLNVLFKRYLIICFISVACLDGVIQ